MLPNKTTASSFGFHLLGDYAIGIIVVFNDLPHCGIGILLESHRAKNGFHFLVYAFVEGSAY
jgi:hypothetical protein